MTHIEDEINDLKVALLKMMALTIKQLEKGQEAVLSFDHDLAHEIVYYENKVNAYELKIDDDCENILALFNPVAIDLRFVLAVYKTSDNLERLGDYAEGIAHYILHFDKELNQEILEKLRFKEMYDVILNMLNCVYNAFEQENTKLARKVFPQDKIVNEINAIAAKTIVPIMKENPDQMGQLLYILSIIRKLERVGDLTKNIAEDTIFYVEAKVLKHKGKMKENEQE